MKNYKKFSGIIFGFLIFFFTSCADQITSESDVLDPPVNPGENLSSLSSIQKNIFTPSCAISGCHSGANPQAGLNLSEGNSHSSLVNVTSKLNPPQKLVESGNSANSFLITVLTWQGNIKMPLGGQKLPDSMIDSIKVWIDKGAPND